MTPFLKELFIVFGGNATLLLVLGFLCKSLLSQMLTRDIETFRAELKADADMSLERLKNSLQMAALEHQVRFSNLHEKRAEVLADLYKQLVETYFEVQRYVYQLGMRGDEELYVAVEKKLFEFANLFETRRIYLPKQVCDRLQSFMAALREPVVNVWVYAKIDRPTPETIQERSVALKKAFDGFSGDLLQARQLIEAEFRHILEGTRPSS